MTDAVPWACIKVLNNTSLVVVKFLSPKPAFWEKGFNILPARRVVACSPVVYSYKRLVKSILLYAGGKERKAYTRRDKISAYHGTPASYHPPD